MQSIMGSQVYARGKINAVTELRHLYNLHVACQHINLLMPTGYVMHKQV